MMRDCGRSRRRLHSEMGNEGDRAGDFIRLSFVPVMERALHNKTIQSLHIMGTTLHCLSNY